MIRRSSGRWRSGPIDTPTLAAATDRCTSILADHASRLLFVKGINYPNGGTGCGHASGLAQTLTGLAPTGAGNKAVSTGESADTTIAKLVNPAGVDPLTLYSGLKEGYINEKLSFSAAGQVRAAEGNPYNVYKKLMGVATPGGTGGGSTTIDQLVKRRKSCNDLVRAELNSLRKRLRSVERRQAAARSALQLHPRSREHHDRHGDAVLDSRASTSPRSTRSTPAARSARTGRSRTSPSCRWTWSGSRSPAT